MTGRTLPSRSLRSLFEAEEGVRELSRKPTGRWGFGGVSREQSFPVRPSIGVMPPGQTSRSVGTTSKLTPVVSFERRFASFERLRSLARTAVRLLESFSLRALLRHFAPRKSARSGIRTPVVGSKGPHDWPDYTNRAASTRPRYRHISAVLRSRSRPFRSFQRVSNPSLELDQSMVGSNVTPPAEEHEVPSRYASDRFCTSNQGNHVQNRAPRVHRNQ